jgi:quercetin dioxygenase-like cupin family protein
MSKLIDPRAADWQPVRPELTAGITGKLLLDGATKVMLTRVAPGGVFRPHRDNYGHLFHILSGQALAKVEAQEYRLAAGMALQVDAGELHGYENCGEEELLLVSLNLPQ